MERPLPHLEQASGAIGRPFRHSRPTFQAVSDLRPFTMADAVWTDEVLRRAYTEVVEDGWPVKSAQLDPIGFAPEAHVLLRFQFETGVVMAIEAEGVLALIRLIRGYLHVLAASGEAALTREFVRRAREAYPKAAAQEDPRVVPITFWLYHESHGPEASRRDIEVSTWDEIHENYPASTQPELGRLMTDFEPDHGGQLILWHGQPGTGKTFALRALAWEWREWCEVHYVMDPESLFGGDPDYLLGLALGSEQNESTWRLLVLEDTGEMLAPDAKSRVGQGLSRLLNLTDGFIGQGLRVLLLVTASEPLTRLHEAVARPGRCAVAVEFKPLTADEASRWLRARNVERTRGTSAGSVTIAELHAALSGKATPQRLSVGFAAL